MNANRLDYLAEWFKNEPNVAIKCKVRELAKFCYDELFTSLCELTPQEVEEGRRCGKIAAIKMFRGRTASSLIDAKNSVEAHFTKNRLEFEDLRPNRF